MHLASLLSISPHILQVCDIGGQTLGVMGSLFFAYDLLGRPGGLLRWILQIVVPGSISTAILLFSALLAIIALRPPYATAVNIATTLGIFGAILGTFNGVFVAAPGTAGRKHLFSFRDAAAGALLVACVYALAELLGILLIPPTVGDLYSAVITVCVGTVAAGMWRQVNQRRPAFGGTWKNRLYSASLLAAYLTVLLAVVALYTNRNHDEFSIKVAGIVIGYVPISFILWYAGRRRDAPAGVVATPAVYSRRGARIGLLAGFSMTFLTIFIFFVYASTIGELYDLDLLSFTFTATVYAALASVGGAFSGGFTQYVFWKVNQLPERRMQVIGLFLILTGFCVQIVQPAIGLIGIPVR